MKVIKFLLYLKILLSILLIPQYSTLNIHSTLPDYIVIWLKRHIYIEIENIKDYDETKKSCSSANGPFCKYLKNISTNIYDKNIEIFRFDHLYNFNYSKNEKLTNKLLYLEIIDNLNNMSEMVKLRLIDHPFESVKENELLSESEYYNNYIKMNHNTSFIHDCCKFNKNNLIYCMKFIFKKVMDNFYDFISIFISKYLSFIELKIFNKIYSSLFKKDRKLRYNKRNKKVKNTDDMKIYKFINEYNLPPEDVNFSKKKNFEESKKKKDELKYFSGYKSDYMSISLDSNILFDNILKNFLRSKYVKISLANCLTWILEQKDSYIDTWNDWRNERLNKYYILNVDKEDNDNNNNFLVSPYSKIKIHLNLLNGDFHSNFRVIRKSWNGVSLKMNFSTIRPDIYLLPSSYCNDEKLVCKWEGIWEINNDDKLSVRLMTRIGKFYIKNEKFVISNLPITISNVIIKDKFSFKDFIEDKLIIYGYNNFRLMWKSTIPINNLIEKINGNYQNKWINALDFSDTIPYSLIDTIYFEVNYSLKENSQRLVLGQFVYNLLNPSFNYIPINNDEFKKYPMEIDEKSKISLAMYFHIKKKHLKNKMFTLNITTMYLSRASPMISVYDLENKGLNLKYEVDEDTSCIIKRNLVDITKE